MTTIRDVIDAFAALEATLEISEPYPAKIERVYKYLPPAIDVLDLPCIMHQYRPVSEARRLNAVRERVYAIRIDVFLSKFPDEQSDIISEMGAAFDEAIVSAFDADVLMTTANATYQRLYDFGGNDYQPALMEWNGASYIGLRYEYEATIRDTGSFSA